MHSQHLRSSSQLIRYEARSPEFSGGLSCWSLPPGCPPPQVINVFTEAEVRANVVFQLSKLAALLLRAARTAAGVSQWDGLVVGTAGDQVQLLLGRERTQPSHLHATFLPLPLLGGTAQAMLRVGRIRRGKRRICVDLSFGDGAAHSYVLPHHFLPHEHLSLQS